MSTKRKEQHDRLQTNDKNAVGGATAQRMQALRTTDATAQMGADRAGEIEAQTKGSGVVRATSESS